MAIHIGEGRRIVTAIASLVTNAKNKARDIPKQLLKLGNIKNILNPVPANKGKAAYDIGIGNFRAIPGEALASLLD